MFARQDRKDSYFDRKGDGNFVWIKSLPLLVPFALACCVLAGAATPVESLIAAVAGESSGAPQVCMTAHPHGAGAKSLCE